MGYIVGNIIIILFYFMIIELPKGNSGGKSWFNVKH